MSTWPTAADWMLVVLIANVTWGVVSLKRRLDRIEKKLEEGE